MPTRGCSGRVTIYRFLRACIISTALALILHSAPHALGRSETGKDSLEVALDHIYNLEFGQARSIIEARIQQDLTDLREVGAAQTAAGRGGTVRDRSLRQ